MADTSALPTTLLGADGTAEAAYGGVAPPPSLENSLESTRSTLGDSHNEQFAAGVFGAVSYVPRQRAHIADIVVLEATGSSLSLEQSNGSKCGLPSRQERNDSVPPPPNARRPFDLAVGISTLFESTGVNQPNTRGVMRHFSTSTTDALQRSVSRGAHNQSICGDSQRTVLSRHSRRQHQFVGDRHQRQRFRQRDGYKVTSVTTSFEAVLEGSQGSWGVEHGAEWPTEQLADTFFGSAADLAMSTTTTTTTTTTHSSSTPPTAASTCTLTATQPMLPDARSTGSSATSSTVATTATATAAVAATAVASTLPPLLRDSAQSSGYYGAVGSGVYGTDYSSDELGPLSSDSYAYAHAIPRTNTRVGFGPVFELRSPRSQLSSDGGGGVNRYSVCASQRRNSQPFTASRAATHASALGALGLSPVSERGVANAVGSAVALNASAASSRSAGAFSQTGDDVLSERFQYLDYAEPPSTAAASVEPLALPSGLQLLLNFAGVAGPRSSNQCLAVSGHAVVLVLATAVCALCVCGAAYARKYLGAFGGKETYLTVTLIFVFGAVLPIICALYLHFWVRCGAFELLVENCKELSPSAYRRIRESRTLSLGPVLACLVCAAVRGVSVILYLLSECGVSTVKQPVVYVIAVTVGGVAMFAWHVLVLTALAVCWCTSRIFVVLTEDYRDILRLFTQPAYEAIGFQETNVVGFSRMVQTRVELQCLSQSGVHGHLSSAGERTVVVGVDESSQTGTLEATVRTSSTRSSQTRSLNATVVAGSGHSTPAVSLERSCGNRPAGANDPYRRPRLAQQQQQQPARNPSGMSKGMFNRMSTSETVATPEDVHARRALLLRLDHQLDLLEVASTKQMPWVSSLVAASAVWVMCCAYSVTLDHHLTVAYASGCMQFVYCGLLVVSVALPSLAMTKLVHEVGRFHTVCPEVCDNHLYSHVVSQKGVGLWLFGVTVDSHFLLRALSLAVTVCLAVMREAFGATNKNLG